MQNFISIQFDKSHLSTIGERMYTQSLDLVRELISNSYDADATEVRIDIYDNRLVIEDNGVGMDKVGLQQYFTIGSDYKKLNPLSLRFKRARIGEFGIGKFAVLSICDRFEIFTQSDKYSGTLIFDRIDFEARQDWNVPLIDHQVSGAEFGTRISLFKLKKTVLLSDIERHLINIFPLSEKNFAIILNGQRLQPKYISGLHFKIREETQFGLISGEAVISSLVLNKEQIGIGIRVKGVLIKRETFNIEVTHRVSIHRLSGEVNADFLLVTSSRNDLVIDSPQYEEFYKIMSKNLRRVVKTMEKSSENYQDKKAEKILSDTLLTVREALKKNMDILLLEGLPLFSKKPAQIKDDGIGEGVIATALSKESSSGGREEKVFAKDDLGQALKKVKPGMRSKLKTLLRDESRIVKKIKIGGNNFLVSFAHLGDEEKESFAEGGMIFINRDHRLFKNIEKKSELVTYHLIRLVTQEIVKLSSPRDLEIAYEWQGKLIRDAFLALKTN